MDIIPEVQLKGTKSTGSRVERRNLQRSVLAIGGIDGFPAVCQN